MPRWRTHLLYALVLLVLAAGLLWPIGLMVAGGFQTRDGQWTLEHFQSVLTDFTFRTGLLNSFIIAVLTTLLSAAIALPLAILSQRHRFPGKAVLSALVLAPLVLPPFVGAIGLRAMLGRFGAVNAMLVNLGIIDWAHAIDFLGGRWLPDVYPLNLVGGRMLSVVLIEALHLYPILYLNTASALANVDPSLDEAARGLGVGRWQRMFRITLPLISPGIFAGSTIVFIWSFTELGTPLMFGFYDVTPVQVYRGVQDLAADPRPYALVVLMLLAASGLYGMSRLLWGGQAYAMQSKAVASSGETPLTGVRGALACAAFLAAIGLALLPHIGLVIASISQEGSWYQSVLPAHWTLSHYEQALSHPLSAGAIRNSLLYSSLAMVLCMALGLAIAHLVVRAKVPGAWIIDSLAMLPLAVPGLVMAFGYWAMTLRWPFPQLAAWFESQGWGDAASLLRVTGTTPNPTLLLVIAYAVRRLPYVVRSASAGLQQTSVSLEEAARGLGAPPLLTLRRIVLPLILANLIAGGILAFAFAMLEVSDSLLLAQKEVHFPITRAIYELFTRLGDGPYVAGALGVWGMLLLMVTLVGAGMLMGKRMGALFRG